MLQDLLVRKNMNIRQLAIKSGVGYNYVYKLVKGQSDIGSCGIYTAKKLANALDMTLDEFYVEVEESFLHFRSSLHHKIKESDDAAILYILQNDLIKSNIHLGYYAKALYALATLDYLCKKNDYDIVSDFDDYRNISLKEMFYPTSIAKELKDKNECIPEFLRYNIYEEDIYDAC